MWLIVVQIFTAVWRVIIWPFASKKINEYSQLPTITAASREISNILREMLKIFNADRASVFLFHNGDYFSNDNSIWKMSCVYEVCASGITSAIEASQDMGAAQWWELIDPLFNGSTYEQDDSCNKQLKSRHVTPIFIRDLEASHAAAFYRAHGTEFSIMAAIYHKLRRHDIVGYVILNYRISPDTHDQWKDKFPKDDLECNCKTLCDYTDRIEFIINHPDRIEKS